MHAEGEKTQENDMTQPPDLFYVELLSTLAGRELVKFNIQYEIAQAQVEAGHFLTHEEKNKIGIEVLQDSRAPLPILRTE